MKTALITVCILFPIMTFAESDRDVPIGVPIGLPNGAPPPSTPPSPPPNSTSADSTVKSPPPRSTSVETPLSSPTSVLHLDDHFGRPPTRYSIGLERFPTGISALKGRWKVFYRNGNAVEMPSPEPILIMYGSPQKGGGHLNPGTLPQPQDSWYPSENVCLQWRWRILREYFPEDEKPPRVHPTGIYHVEIEFNNSCVDWYMFEAYFRVNNPCWGGEAWRSIGRFEVPPTKTRGILVFADPYFESTRVASVLLADVRKAGGSMELGASPAPAQSEWDEEFPRIEEDARGRMVDAAKLYLPTQEELNESLADYNRSEKRQIETCKRHDRLMERIREGNKKFAESNFDWFSSNENLGPVESIDEEPVTPGSDPLMDEIRKGNEEFKRM